MFRFMLVTVQLKGELVGAECDEFDLASVWWTIPAEKAKNGLPHRVPLSPLAMRLIKGIQKANGDTDYLFPSSQGSKPIRDDAISKAVRRNESALNIAHFTPHDLRRTVASQMASAGSSRLVISKILNRVDSGVTAVYDRDSDDAENRKARNAGAGQRETITSGEKGRKVGRIK